MPDTPAEPAEPGTELERSEPLADQARRDARVLLLVSVVFLLLGIGACSFLPFNGQIDDDDPVVPLSVVSLCAATVCFLWAQVRLWREKARAPQRPLDVNMLRSIGAVALAYFVIARSWHYLLAAIVCFGWAQIRSGRETQPANPASNKPENTTEKG